MKILFQKNIKIIKTAQGCGSSRIFCASASSSSWSVMLPSSLPLPHSWVFLLPLPDKVVRFRFLHILLKSFCFLQNFIASSFRFLNVQKICQVYCLDRYHKMRRLQSSLKVVYYNFFYCRSILVTLYGAVAIPGPGGQNNLPSPPDEIRSFSF